MPKQVVLKKNREFVFKQGKGGGVNSRYDWDAWLNGDLLLLQQSLGAKDEDGNVVGEPTERRDYEIRTDQMPGKIRFAGRKRYKHVDISRYDADGKKLVDELIIRARDMTADEREAEDVRRAEEKANRKPRGGSDGDADGQEEAA